MSKVLASGDKHFPYTKKVFLNKLYKLIKKEKPDIIIDMGDLYDQYVFARFDRDLNFTNPKKEVAKMRKSAEDYWATIRNAAPKARLIQLLGNHDVRMLKKCLSTFPEAYDFLKTVHEGLYDFAGVEVKKSDKEYVEIDGVVYCHGWMTKHTAHFGKSVVRAHDHKVWMEAKMDLKKTNNEFIFEASCGCFGDQSAVPLGYPSSKFTGWQAGALIIDDGYPRKPIIL